MTFTAIINTPGYLPDSDDIPVFATAAEAWAYLADDRRWDEDEAEDWGPDNGLSYSDTVYELQNSSEPGVIYGSTPGYEGDHDLGLAYSVQEVELWVTAPNAENTIRKPTPGIWQCITSAAN